MRSFGAIACLLFAMTACASSAEQPSTASPPPSTSQTAESTVSAPSSTPIASASTPRAEATPAQTLPAPPLPKGALLVYVEGEDAYAFTPPRRVTRVTPGSKPCTYELSDNGNAYSGKEVEGAFKSADVQAAIKTSPSFLPPADVSVSGQVQSSAGGITWVPACGGLCVGGPPGVGQLVRVLHGVMVTMRGVCSGR